MRHVPKHLQRTPTRSGCSVQQECSKSLRVRAASGPQAQDRSTHRSRILLRELLALAYVYSRVHASPHAHRPQSPRLSAAQSARLSPHTRRCGPRAPAPEGRNFTEPVSQNRRSSLRPSLVISQLGKNASTVRLRQDLAGFRHRSAQALTLEVCGSRRKRRGAERFPCRVGTRRYRLGARLLMLGERIKCGANHA
jgi:hypothetical protein